MAFQQARQKAGLTQQQAATALGINQATVCLWESGKTSPRAALLPRIAALYHCTVDDLLRKD